MDKYVVDIEDGRDDDSNAQHEECLGFNKVKEIHLFLPRSGGKYVAQAFREEEENGTGR